MTFSRSRDGSAFHDFTIPPETVPNWANERDSGHRRELRDGRAARHHGQACGRGPLLALGRRRVWDQLGDTQSEPNDDRRSDLRLRCARSRSVAGHRDSSEWSASARTSSDLNSIGTSEVARMRGDVTSNPSYDRYGNTWTNHGTWSYEDMQDMPTLPPPA